MYIYVYTHIYICTYKNTYICILDTYTYIYIYIYRYMYMKNIGDTVQSTNMACWKIAPKPFDAFLGHGGRHPFRHRCQEASNSLLSRIAEGRAG